MRVLGFCDFFCGFCDFFCGEFSDRVNFFGGGVFGSLQTHTYTYNTGAKRNGVQLQRDDLRCESWIEGFKKCYSLTYIMPVSMLCYQKYQFIIMVSLFYSIQAPHDHYHMRLLN